VDGSAALDVVTGGVVAGVVDEGVVGGGAEVAEERAARAVRRSVAVFVAGRAVARSASAVRVDASRVRTGFAVVVDVPGAGAASCGQIVRSPMLGGSRRPPSCQTQASVPPGAGSWAPAPRELYTQVLEPLARYQYDQYVVVLVRSHAGTPSTWQTSPG
jgi:hypothetical protein